MDVAALSSSAGRLLEALEHLGTSQGADLRSLGPGGTPSADLVRAFEDALNGFGGEAPGAGGQPASGQQSEVSAQDNVNPDFTLEKMPDGTLRVPAANDTVPSETVQNRAAEMEEARADTRGASAPQQADFQELAELLEKITSGQMNPTELYRLQYLVGMLKVHAGAGTRLSEQTSQNLESVLKQQG